MKYLFLFSLIGFISCSNAQQELKSHKEVLLLMGSRFEITAMADNTKIAQSAVSTAISEIQRIESLISSWQESSQTSEINRNAGIKPVMVDDELFFLIKRSLKVSKITDGAFDISFASMDRIYTFDRQEHTLPSAENLEKAIEKINWQNIILDPEAKTVFLKEVGMKIGFGAIGKGYAANKAKEVISALDGVQGGVINASGDLIVWGANGKENGWPIQISNPKNISESIGWLNIKDMSVVTSGNYENYFMSDGKRYAHIINPKTGIPTTGIKSATVICPDAELGDAIATAIFVMGPEKAIEFVNSLKNFEALLITDEDKILTSKNLKLNKY